MQIFRDKVKRFPRYNLANNGKRVVFCDKTRQSNVNNFVLLEVGISMIFILHLSIRSLLSKIDELRYIAIKSKATILSV